MLVAAELTRVLFGGDPAPADAVRIGQLRRDLDRFIEGGRVTIRDGLYRSDPAYMARLDPPGGEIWEIRSVDPRPGLRVFGRFAEEDIFVALLLRTRKQLGGKNDPAWQEVVRHCKAEWRQLFPGHEPHSGKRVCDYVSSAGILLRPVRSPKRDIAGGPCLFPCVDEGEIS
ncbi:MAG: hypothetical protein KGL12_00285 [Rhodospirillales bacterium]|nr:hypothetical protein [Rhodospirillales bacterium]